MIFCRRSFLAASTASLLTGGTPVLSNKYIPTHQQFFTLRGEIQNGLDSTVTCVHPATKRISLTFDDGPHPIQTPLLLDILKSYDVQATFFVIGCYVEHRSKIIARIHDEGHQLGNHTYSHSDMSSLTMDEVLSEIDRTNELVYKAAGIETKIFRPPFGALQEEKRFELFKKREMPTVLWSVDPKDWLRPGKQHISDYVIKYSKSGSIVLTHDIFRSTVNAVPEILDTLISQGYSFETVSNLTEKPLT